MITRVNLNDAFDVDIRHFPCNKLHQEFFSMCITDRDGLGGQLDLTLSTSGLQKLVDAASAALQDAHRLANNGYPADTQEVMADGNPPPF